MNPARSSLIRLGGLFLMLAATCTAAPGQGQVIIDPPRRVPPRPWPRPTPQTTLELKYLRVYADITDGVATTRVEQTFRNPFRYQVEGTYVLPLADDAAVGDFSMIVNGKTMHGEVLDKETARRTYEEIVRRTRDPGLLEYLGKRLYQASIFPVPPGGEIDVKLSYSQTLAESGGLGLFRHALRGHRPGRTPIEQIIVQAKIKSTLPLTSVFCPSHKTDVVRPNDHEATVTYEAGQARPDRDFQLYYQRKDAQFGLSLLTHRGAGEAGYFLLRISPRVEISEDQIQPKDIAFVIDTSGSMANDEKLEQVKQALKFCINSLAEHDRFNIYGFSTEVHPFRDTLVPADGDVKQAALDFTGRMKPIGGTNVHQALLAALAGDPRDGQRPYLIVFMTDGEPTIDVTQPDQILKNVGDKNTQRVRFHVLGVGNDVNTHLLDKLAELNRGTREYCTPGENLELKLSTFYARLAHPVLTDITATIEGLNTTDVYPKVIPDLFRGNDIMLLGRYDGTGQRAVRVKGRLRDSERTFTYEGAFPKINTGHEFLPRLWATRKVAYLLDQIRLHGRKQEVVDEVVRLAKRHGIVTPYTSALILEEDTLIARRGGFGGGRVIHDAAGAMRDRLRGRGNIAKMPARASGERAVVAARETDRLSRLGYVGGEANAEAGIAWDYEVLYPKNWREMPASERRGTMQHVADKAFVFDGQRWLDTTWDGKQEAKQITVFSDEYFELIKQHPRLAEYFALGERVVVVWDGQVYETVEEDSSE